MSNPVRITNPGAESLGYDSDGHEAMTVDIYVNPPRVDVFHGTPPARSSFGNKITWGGNEWVDDSPTRSDIEKGDKEITAHKNTLSAQQKENENRRTEAGRCLSAAIAAREKDRNTLKTLRVGNADAADITRQEFRLLQAELREYGFCTEVAGYDAFRLHTESWTLFVDTDSFRISSREARSSIEQAEKRQKDAQNAGKKAVDMLAEYEHRKGILDTRSSELEKNGGAALVVLDVQQARLLGQQTQNDRAILEARNKLSSVAESLKTARNALARTEQQLTQQKNMPDGKTTVFPEKFPGRSSIDHSIVVSGDSRFVGTIKIITSAVIDDRANLNYLPAHLDSDYKHNILNDWNPVVIEDMEGDKKIYNVEAVEWDKLRQRLLDTRNKITSAESAVSSAGNNVSTRTNEQKHTNDAPNALLKEEENTRSQLADINQKIVEEKRKKDKMNMVKDAIKLTSDFYRTIYDEFGKQVSELAKEPASVSQGKQVKSVDDALNAFNKFRNSLGKKYNIQDRMAISKVLEAINRVHMAENFKLFSKAFGSTGKVTGHYDVAMELQKATKTDNWRPFFVKPESLAAGRAVSAVTAWVLSVMLGTPVGVLGLAIIMATVSAPVNDKFIEQVNKLIGI